MTVSRGDVVIALFPNSDGSPPKPRPVVVVQSDTYNRTLTNVVVVAVTTNLRYAADPASVAIDVSTPDGRASGLVQNSVVSCVNLATISDTLLVKRIGRLPDPLMRQVDAAVKVALGLP